MHRWIWVCAAIVAACDQYKEPPATRDVVPLTTRSQEMAWSGIDYGGTGPGAPAGSGVFGPGTGITESAPGRGSTQPSADLDQPEMRNAQRGGRVYRPSDHYFVNGVDMGPSWDAAPGTGGPEKMRTKQP